MRQENRPVTAIDLSALIAHCDEWLDGMRREQSNYHDVHAASNQPGGHFRGCAARTVCLLEALPRLVDAYVAVGTIRDEIWGLAAKRGERGCSLPLYRDPATRGTSRESANGLTGGGVRA